VIDLSDMIKPFLYSVFLAFVMCMDGALGSDIRKNVCERTVIACSMT
jgi:hypothetical protein